MGSSPGMQQAYHFVSRFAQSDEVVPITGETGVGKTLFAQAIHDNSNRRNGPFYPISMPSFTETLIESELFGHLRGSFTGAVADKKGLVEVAEQGTTFLDDIQYLTLPMQAKLLRVLDTKQYRQVGGTKERATNMRFVVATNRDLREMVECGQFLPDLFYSLNGMAISIPPLRERREDLPALIEGFLQQQRKELRRADLTFTPEAMEFLLEYDYPGNIRDLRSLIRRGSIFAEGDEIKRSTLEEAICKAEVPDIGYFLIRDYRETQAAVIAAFQEAYLTGLHGKTSGNAVMASRISGLPKTDVLKQWKKLGII